MQLAQIILVDIPVLAYMDLLGMAHIAWTLMSVPNQTHATKIQLAQILLVLISAHAWMVIQETDRTVKISMNALTLMIATTMHPV
jgi:hypothetical protein